ncbi:hypothetical protein TTRE_0000880401 [Trichuris trichiura]|uniref:Uncharacterized protein n=1 Tax=Trichuris trichiura TaxID=36087 RepID=A0A077ZNY9_TRITR|nr:hypothetical protein TTRE_0000880401 [Trichuris trichiura]
MHSSSMGPIASLAYITLEDLIFFRDKLGFKLVESLPYPPTCWKYIDLYSTCTYPADHQISVYCVMTNKPCTMRSKLQQVMAQAPSLCANLERSGLSSRDAMTTVKIVPLGKDNYDSWKMQPKHILSSRARGNMLTEHFQSQEKTVMLSILGWRAMPPRNQI